MDYYWWFVLALALFAIEIITPGFVIMWFGVGALVAGLADLLGVNNIYVQVILFTTSSLILVTLSRTIFKHIFIKKSPGNELKTNASALLGKVGVVTLEINNDLSQGRALVEGQDWTARSLDGTILKVDEKVKIHHFEGAKLLVERIS